MPQIDCTSAEKLTGDCEQRQALAAAPNLGDPPIPNIILPEYCKKVAGALGLVVNVVNTVPPAPPLSAASSALYALEKLVCPRLPPVLGEPPGHPSDFANKL